MTLVTFLLARIAEDEATAKDNTNLLTFGVADTKTREYLGQFNPARMIIECESKRSIVELHTPVTDWKIFWHDEIVDRPDDSACTTCGSFFEYPERWPCSTVRALALPYVDHCDYQNEWRPITITTNESTSK